MTSNQQTGLSSERIHDASESMLSHLQCCICRDILWKPVACQACETPFCSSCIKQWLNTNPNKCPNRCVMYAERKCSPLYVKLLAQLKVHCFYQSKGCQEVSSYEALDKHEMKCNYQSEQCPGCRTEILKKDFDDHTKNCLLIETICPDCKIMYKRGDAATKHTENSCLKEQLRQVCNVLKEAKNEIDELNVQVKELLRLNPTLTKMKIIFDDLADAIEAVKDIPSTYKGLKWTNISYGHELFFKKTYPNSGYVTGFIPGGSSHIAYFSKKGLISVEQPNKKFTFISISACAAWNDKLQLTIKGYRNSMQTNTHTVILLYGKPRLILLNWENIDEVTFTPFGGTAHPGSGGHAWEHVVITEIVVGPVYEKSF